MNYAQRWTMAVALKNAPTETSGGATGDYEASDPPLTAREHRVGWSVGAIAGIGGLLMGFIGGLVWSDYN